MNDVKRVLCAVDFDEPSRQALDYGLGLAGRLGAAVTVVHAYEIPVYPVPEDGMVELPVEVEADLEQRIRDRLTAFVAEGVAAAGTGGVEVESRVLEGQPDVVACRLAEDIGADLLVVGTHGRHGLAHFILGSTAERIVRNARVPVLSVRGG